MSDHLWQIPGSISPEIQSLNPDMARMARAAELVALNTFASSWTSGTASNLAFETAARMAVEICEEYEKSKIQDGKENTAPAMGSRPEAGSL